MTRERALKGASQTRHHHGDEAERSSAPLTEIAAELRKLERQARELGLDEEADVLAQLRCAWTMRGERNTWAKDVAAAHASADPATMAAFEREMAATTPATAFPRRYTLGDPLADEWLMEDPNRLVVVVREMLRFSRDENKVIEAAAHLADRLGIPDEMAEVVIAEGIVRGRRDRAARRRGADHGN